MNSAEGCEFDKKNQPITVSYRWSYMLGLSTAAVRSVIFGGASEYEYQLHQQQYSRQRRSTSTMYVQSFVFAGRVEGRLLESRPSVVSSVRNTDQSHRSISYVSYILVLSTAARYDLQRLFEIRILLQQHQYSCSEASCFKYVQSEIKYPYQARPISVSDILISRSFQS